MRRKYYLAEIIKKGEYDFKVTYGLPSKIECKLTTDHPCIICKDAEYGIDKTIFCILANSQMDAENKLIKYLRIPARRLAF